MQSSINSAILSGHSFERAEIFRRQLEFEKKHNIEIRSHNENQLKLDKLKVEHDKLKAEHDKLKAEHDKLKFLFSKYCKINEEESKILGVDLITEEDFYG